MPALSCLVRDFCIYVNPHLFNGAHIPLRVCRPPDFADSRTSAPEQDRKARTLVAQNIGEGTALLEQGSKLQTTRPGGGIILNSEFGIDTFILNFGGDGGDSLPFFIT